MQSVPEKMKLEMVIGMKIEILNVATGQFSNGLFKKKHELQSFPISDFIPMNLSSFVFSGTGSIVNVKKPQC